MEKIRFGIVGSGWRAMFYVRIARTRPDIFELAFLLCRTEEKARRLRLENDIPATADETECEGRHVDFVVVAVSKGENFAVTEKWLKKGAAVLAETPAGTGMEELSALWGFHLVGARLAVAEQYFRYPLIAAGLRAIDAGLIGNPDSVELSLVHDYHAASLMRRMLGLHRMDSLPEFRLRGREYVYPVEETDSRGGPVSDGSVKDRARVRIDVEFEGGKTAFYDFDGVQYHSFIRGRHINVRGVRGEWNDTVVRYSDSGHEPGLLRLLAEAVPGYEGLMTEGLYEIAGRWNPFVHMEPEQDEYAIATLLADMGEYVRTGREFYPLREALEDAYMWILMSKALEEPGSEAASGERPWKG